jgi:glycosyltransferase involved in cell wall biosynthesis
MATRHVESLLESTRPDVMHVHAGTVSPFAYLTARLGVEEGLPVATTWHSMLDHASPLLRPWVRATGWRRAPIAWSAVSRVAADVISRLFESEVSVLNNGIDIKGWTPPPGQLQDGPPPLRCVAAMRLVPSKRGPDLIDIFANAASLLPPGSLLLEIFGDGPERLLIQRRIRARRVGQIVTLHGRVPRETLRNSYFASHVFCSAATREAFGIAALEARAAGLVIVARAGTGIEDFVTEDDGVLPTTDREMSAALVRLAADRESLDTLLETTRSVPPPFDIDDVMTAATAEYQRARALRLSGASSPV